MNNTQLETIDQIQAFLLGSQAIDLVIEDKAERYQWIRRTLVRLNYLQLGKSEKGIVLRYLGEITGYENRKNKPPFYSIKKISMEQ